MDKHIDVFGRDKCTKFNNLMINLGKCGITYDSYCLDVLEKKTYFKKMCAEYKVVKENLKDEHFPVVFVDKICLKNPTVGDIKRELL